MTQDYPDREKSTGRERLIRAASILAQQRAFDEITIEEIVKAASLSRPAFYYHFAGGKEELRAELVREGWVENKPTQDTHQHLLDSALRVFARSGVSAATMDDIAAEAGISRGALCWHFRSKEDLLSAVIECNTGYLPLRAAIEQVEQDLHNGIPLDQETILRRVAAGFYDSFTSQDNTTRLSILLIHTHPEAAHILANRIVRGRRAISAYIKSQQEAGLFRKEIDAALFVQVMAATFVMRSIARGLSDILPFSHLSREECIEQLVSLLLYGIVQQQQPTDTTKT